MKIYVISLRLVYNIVSLIQSGTLNTIVYTNSSIGLAFAGACYTILVTTVMLFGLIHQLILISQNCTSQELHTAAKNGQVKWSVYKTNNPYNNGVIQNWQDFIVKKRTVIVSETV